MSEIKPKMVDGEAVREMCLRCSGNTYKEIDGLRAALAASEEQVRRLMEQDASEVDATVRRLRTVDIPHLQKRLAASEAEVERKTEQADKFHKMYLEVVSKLTHANTRRENLREACEVRGKALESAEGALEIMETWMLDKFGKGAHTEYKDERDAIEARLKSEASGELCKHPAMISDGEQMSCPDCGYDHFTPDVHEE